MNTEEAQEFVYDWLLSWNEHNLERILSHYEEDIVLFSPAITQLLGEPSGELRGKNKVREYWAKALAAYPDLNFRIESVFTGVQTVTVIYEGVAGKAAECFWFRENGKVFKSEVQYALRAR